MNTETCETGGKQCGTADQGNCDQSLVSAAMDGDLAAFTDLCKLHSPRLSRMVYQITRNHEDAEDALQDALMRAFVHLRSFNGQAQFSTWLTRIALNSALMLLRKRKHYPGVSIDSSPQEEDRFSSWEIADSADDPECHLLKSETTEWLRKAIGGLDQTLRVAMELWDIEQVSTREGARQLNISIAAYKSRVMRAKASLRTQLTISTGMRNLAQQHSKEAPGGPFQCGR